MNEETTINGIDVSECAYFNSATYEEPYCNIDQEHLYTCSSDEDCYFKQLKRLQKENEELKARFNELYNNSKQLANKYNKYGGNKENELVEIINKIADEKNKYKQSLEEISSIAENLITETPEYHSCYYKDECGDNCTPKKQGKIEFCCYENVDKILTIINEVLNDRD